MAKGKARRKRRRATTLEQAIAIRNDYSDRLEYWIKKTTSAAAKAAFYQKKLNQYSKRVAAVELAREQAAEALADELNAELELQRRAARSIQLRE